MLSYRPLLDKEDDEEEEEEDDDDHDDDDDYDIYVGFTYNSLSTSISFWIDLATPYSEEQVVSTP